MTERPKMLVTGGSGYLGGWVARLACDDWDVTATCFSHPVDAPDVVWHSLDVRDEASVRALTSEVRPDVVIHTAAANPGSGAEYFAVNAGGTYNVARSAAEWGARLIHLSTDVVFDGEKGNYVEEDPPRPVHDYGRSKARAEEAVIEAGGEAAIIRTSLIYGWRPYIGRHTQWVIDALAAEETVRLFADEIRNPIWVESLAAAVVELAGSDYTGTLHVAGAQALSRYEFGLRMLRFHGIDPGAIVPASSRDLGLARPLDCTLDCSRANTILLTPLPGVDQVLAAHEVG